MEWNYIYKINNIYVTNTKDSRISIWIYIQGIHNETTNIIIHLMFANYSVSQSIKI